MRFKCLLIIVLMAAVFFSCNQNNNSMISDSDSVQRTSILKEQLDFFLRDSSANVLHGEILIKDTQALIAITEPILFSIYGEEKIKGERPYEICLFGDYWIMSGTMANNSFGGTFAIAINRRTCSVIGITHGK